MGHGRRGDLWAEHEHDRGLGTDVVRGWARAGARPKWCGDAKGRWLHAARAVNGCGLVVCECGLGGARAQQRRLSSPARWPEVAADSARGTRLGRLAGAAGQHAQHAWGDARARRGQWAQRRWRRDAVGMAQRHS